MPNADCRMPNADCRLPIAERMTRHETMPNVVARGGVVLLRCCGSATLLAARVATQAQSSSGSGVPEPQRRHGGCSRHSVGGACHRMVADMALPCCLRFRVEIPATGGLGYCPVRGGWIVPPSVHV